MKLDIVKTKLETWRGALESKGFRLKQNILSVNCELQEIWSDGLESKGFEISGN